MSKLHSQQQSETLIEILAEDDAVSRASAARALGQYREGRAVSALLPLLQDADADVRAATAEALGILRAGRAAVQLRIMQQDDSEVVRKQAERALRLIATKPAFIFKFTNIPHATRDPQQPKSNKCRRSLLHLQQALTDEINERLSEQRLEVVRIDTNPISASEVATIALTLSEKRLRYDAIELLKQCNDPQAIAALYQAVNAEPLLALYAARELARKGEPLLLEPFVRCLNEIVMFLPDEAIESLVELHDIHGAGVLISALSHQRIDIREQAGQALLVITGMDFGWDVELWERWQGQSVALRRI